MREIVRRQRKRRLANPDIQLTPGDVIRYTYKYQHEFSRWNGDGTRTVIAVDNPPTLATISQYARSLGYTGRIIAGTWRRDEFIPFAILKQRME